ncbi:hypothetical protein PV04_09517 [Phialophora macrospora]|uniref:Uncharacterized protein n=1 Tax=Phialophora macrospora TaxID=1851006 RepID=A0A0D2FXF3_9EURO|nr:hypothetical protein PV04_09517 [Phialophora macrospora]
MRGLWTQASRPRLTASHHLSCTDSFSATLVRKTTTRPPRRRPSFAEHVFTLLLTPVLAAALFVDTSWKAKQRRDWDDKLAAINHEITQLREQEQRLRSSLQLRDIHHGLYQQRRGYATAAYAQVEIEDDHIPGEIEMPTWEEDASVENEVSAGESSHIREVLSAKEFSPEQLSNFRRYHRLNAITLALRMLLHLRIGPNPFYSITPEDDPVDIAALESLDASTGVSLPTDTDRLVQMLALTRKQMRSLRNLDDLFYAAPQIQAQANRGALRQTIHDLTVEFDTGNLSLPGLVDGYGKAILQSKEVPCISVYVMLIRSLSKVGSYSLAYHAAAAMKNSTLPLSDPAIFYMLLQIGRACDSRSLNNLLHFIANADNPLNLIHKWEKARVHGLDLPVPATLNPRLLMALVYVALRCEQPDRAEAWLSLLREADYGSLWKDDLFRSFLAYHAHHGNWEEGKKWIQRSVNHALSIASQSIDRLARVIYRMLDLCVRCRKLAEYTAILDAAVDSGIGPPLVQKSQNDHRKFHPRTRSILLEWEALPLPDDTETCPGKDKAKSFQYACRSLLEQLSQTLQASAAKQQRDSDDDLILTASTASNPNQRYAVRRREQVSAHSNHTVELAPAELEKLQSKLAEQEVLISEMKARLDLALLRQNSHDKEAAGRQERWIQSAARVAQEVRETKEGYEKLQGRFEAQEAIILQLKVRSALAASRQQSWLEDDTERSQKWIKSTVQMTEQLQELKDGFEKLRRLNELHEQERVQTRQEILELKAAARVVKGQSQSQPPTRGAVKQMQQNDVSLESEARNEEGSNSTHVPRTKAHPRDSDPLLSSSKTLRRPLKAEKRGVPLSQAQESTSTNVAGLAADEDVLRTMVKPPKQADGITESARFRYSSNIPRTKQNPIGGPPSLDKAKFQNIVEPLSRASAPPTLPSTRREETVSPSILLIPQSEADICDSSTTTDSRPHGINAPTITKIFQTGAKQWQQRMPFNDSPGRPVRSRYRRVTLNPQMKANLDTRTAPPSEDDHF